MTLTKTQRELMLHAVGGHEYLLRSGKPPPWRNYFAASQGSKNKMIWEQLEAIGLAVSRPPCEGFPDTCYHVTNKGFDILRQQAPDKLMQLRGRIEAGDFTHADIYLLLDAVEEYRRAIAEIETEGGLAALRGFARGIEARAAAHIARLGAHRA